MVIAKTLGEPLLAKGATSPEPISNSTNHPVNLAPARSKLTSARRTLDNSLLRAAPPRANGCLTTTLVV